MRNNKLIIITPCYNEEEIIEYSIGQLSSLLEKMVADGLISRDSKVCFVNDGSHDRTSDLIKQHCQTNKNIALINLTRNYGQQSALLAGLNIVDADMVVTIDVDLQDNPLVIKDMVKKYQEGYEVVYGCRKKRDTDSFLKKNTALLFYKFMNLIGIDIVQNHSEFRLLSRVAIEKLKEYKEKTIFLRGIVSYLGLKSTKVYYDRLERIAGQTKYSYFKLIELAWTAITSFSMLPLRLITITGMTISFIGILLLFYWVTSYIKHYPAFGLVSIAMMIVFFSGLILMSLGIIGEYLSKILLEVKNRPLYQIDEILNL